MYSLIRIGNIAYKEREANIEIEKVKLLKNVAAWEEGKNTEFRKEVNMFGLNDKMIKTRLQKRKMTYKECQTDRMLY